MPDPTPDASPAGKELRCPNCNVPVFYDPKNPMYHASGAMRRKPGEPKPTIVYLTCANEHLNRYTVG